MAQSIGGGSNYFMQLQQQIAKGPDAATAESLRQQGGTANTQRKSNTTKQKGVPNEDGGIQLSEAAQKSLHNAHADHIHGHEQELAHHAGLQETEGENNEDHELKVKRGHERDQDEKAEKAEGQLPAGFSVVKGQNGVEQVMSTEQVELINSLDSSPDVVDGRVLHDIPQANLEAAERVVETQLKGGVTKVANLKPVPEADTAGRMELGAAGFHAKPLDIREPGNDRLQPLSLELPEHDMEMARERAAADLASGNHVQEQMMAP